MAMAITMPAPADPWPGMIEVSARDVARVAGMARNALRPVEDEGLVPPVSGGGYGRQLRWSKDDALFLLAAALLAAALGIALVTVVRAMQTHGATRPVGGEFVIPMPSAA